MTVYIKYNSPEEHYSNVWVCENSLGESKICKEI